MRDTDLEKQPLSPQPAQENTGRLRAGLHRFFAQDGNFQYGIAVTAGAVLATVTGVLVKAATDNTTASAFAGVGAGLVSACLANLITGYVLQTAERCAARSPIQP